MKKIATVICVGLTLCSLSAFAKNEKGMMMMNKKSDAMFMESKDIKWKAVEGFDGVEQATLDGDPMKGASHLMMKFKPGFNAPMHHHTPNHYGVVVAGTFVLTTPDGVEHRLSPGSFFSFKNKAKHSTSCAAGAECMISLDARGPWDVVPEKETISSK